MAQMQNMFDFPPAPKLDRSPAGSIPTKATESELRGEKMFFGKGQCAACHPAPYYLDNQMHDLHLERFIDDEPGDGPIKTFTLRGIKESPPYLHDGRCLTLEDTVEFFNLVLALKLTKRRKRTSSPSCGSFNELRQTTHAHDGRDGGRDVCTARKNRCSRPSAMPRSSARSAKTGRARERRPPAANRPARCTRRRLPQMPAPAAIAFSDPRPVKPQADANMASGQIRPKTTFAS